MKKSVSLILILGLALHAGIRDEMSHCAKYSDNKARLGCYDRLQLVDIPETPKVNVPVVTAGSWIKSEDIDPMTDKKVIYLYLNAEDSIPSQYAYIENPKPSLHLRCQNKKTEVYISWNVYLGLNSTMVTTRVDKAYRSKRSWFISTDTKATFAPNGYSFAKGLVGHKKLVANITPYNANPATITFNLDGIDEAIKPLRKECGW